MQHFSFIVQAVAEVDTPKYERAEGI